MNKFKTLAELNLLDRFLFDEAAEDPEFLRTVLEIILDKDIAFASLPQSEKEERFQLLTRQVRLDVWGIDEEGAIYDTEVQKENTHNLPRRSRFYHNIIGATLLKTGEIEYNNLNDVYVILISPFDLFGQGLHRYTFKMRCEESPDISLEEGTTTIFLNTGGTADDVSDELKEMLRYFENTTAASPADTESARIALLRRKVNEIRKREDMGVKQMLAWEEKIRDNEKSLAKGHADEKKANILSAIHEGLSEEMILKIFKISDQQYEEYLAMTDGQ